MPTSALTDLVHPTWAAALEPVAETVAALGRLPARRGRGRPRLPARRRPRAAGVRPAAGRRAGPHRGPGPLPDPGPRRSGSPSRWRPTCGRSRAAWQNIYPSSAPTSACRTPTHRRPDPVGRPGRPAAQPRAHRAPRRKPASHRGKGWETVTAQAIAALVERGGPLVAILWGRDARGLAPAPRRRPLHRVRPPLPAVGARSGFFGSRPFSRANELLVAAGRRTRRLEAAVTSPTRLPSTDLPEPVWTPLRRDRRLVHRGHVRRRTPSRDGRVRRLGRPARLAPGDRSPHEAGHEFGYANLAVRGRLLADVVGPAARRRPRRCSPTSCRMVGGGNDILRPKADLDATRRAARGRGRAHPATRGRRAAGDAGRPGGRAAGRATCAAAHAIHTANIFSIAQRHGAYVINQWGHARPAGLADVGRGPHPHDDRGAPPGRARRALSALGHTHRPRRLDAPRCRPAARHAAARAGRGQRRVGAHSTWRPGSSAGSAGSPRATR